MKRKDAKTTEKNAKYDRQKEIRWEKLDNTAHLFPIISRDKTTNVYRISVMLREEIRPALLQEALDIVLPKFKGFDLRLRRGFFWYYFEENGKPAPKVHKERDFPCRRIIAHQNRSYLFRVSWFERRINLEVFHALADGLGGAIFLRELTYQYLRLAHPELGEQTGDQLAPDTSLNREDSFLNHYRKAHSKEYETQRAYHIRGESLLPGKLGIMHGLMPIEALRSAAHRYQVSINEYLVTAFIWSIYHEKLHGVPGKFPIRIAVPVNLRPYFDSVTTKNFFVMISAEFHPKKEHGPYTFAEVASIVRDGLRRQMDRDHLEKLFSYNVSNERNFMLRAVPLFLKSLFMRQVYAASARAQTSTLTNIGKLEVEEKYRPHIEMFYALLPISKGQKIRTAVCAYEDTLVVNFTSSLRDPLVQRGFFRRLTEDGVPVNLETNGVYYE